MKPQVFTFLTAIINTLVSVFQMENDALWYIMCSVSGGKNYDILFLYPESLSKWMKKWR